MSLFKDDQFNFDRSRLEREALAHANAITQSFNALGCNVHNSVRCTLCQSAGPFFRSLVRNNLDLENMPSVRYTPVRIANQLAHSSVDKHIERL